MDRGHLSYPRKPFAVVFIRAIRFADVGLARLRALPLVLQTPNDLAHVFEAVDDATHEQFAGIMVPVSLTTERPHGWTSPLVRALWRMFVRYALLVAVRQNLVRVGEAKASSASFRQAIDVRGKTGGSAGGHRATTNAPDGRSTLSDLSQDAVYLEGSADITECPNSTDAAEKWEAACGEESYLEEKDLLQDAMGGGADFELLSEVTVASAAPSPDPVGRDPAESSSGVSESKGNMIN
jgi:hypothetical protein